MKLSQFDNRTPAEKGLPLTLKNPAVQDGEELIDNKKPCVVGVRGSSARSVQAETRRRLKAKMSGKKSKADDARVMEDIHSELCEAAAPLITFFENIEIPVDLDKPDGEQRPITTSEEDIKWFLDLTFPVMGAKEDEDGDTVTKNGEVQFEMKNNPFAKQITDYSSELTLNL